MTNPLGGRWEGRIAPGHPSFNRIRDGIHTWQRTPETAGAPTSRQLSDATGIPMGTLKRYMRHLADAGHLVGRKSGRGLIWVWVSDLSRADRIRAEVTEAAGAAPTTDEQSSAASVDLSGPQVRVQLAGAIDSLDGGSKRPYPFIVNALGGIDRALRSPTWPVSAIGFTGDLARQRITLWWNDYFDAADWVQAVGMYLVTESVDGRWATQVTAVESVTEHAAVSA